MKRERVQRSTVALPDWKPVHRDRHISYRYTLNGRSKSLQDRWMRVPQWIAATALHTGVTEFQVDGGFGKREWRRTVTCTEEQADQWFRDRIAAGAFMLKGTYRAALLGQARRLARRSEAQEAHGDQEGQANHARPGEPLSRPSESTFT